MKHYLFAFTFLLLCAYTLAHTCGGNCLSGDCPDCPCGDFTAKVNVTQWCAQNPTWNQTCCQCIMTHLSGGNAHATYYNSTDDTYSVGVALLNQDYWNKYGCPQEAPCSAAANLGCATIVYEFFSSGLGFKTWPGAEECGCA